MKKTDLRLATVMATDFLHFAKYHGLGNDILVVEEDEESGGLLITPELARSLCDRRTGVGCDQLMLVRSVVGDKDVVEYRVRIINADGSEAEACGNGTRKGSPRLIWCCFAILGNLVTTTYVYLVVRVRHFATSNYCNSATYV